MALVEDYLKKLQNDKNTSASTTKKTTATTNNLVSQVASNLVNNANKTTTTTQKSANTTTGSSGSTKSSSGRDLPATTTTTTTTTAPKTNTANSTGTQQAHLQQKINDGVVAAPTATQQAKNNVTPAQVTATGGVNSVGNATNLGSRTSIVNIEDTPKATTTSAPKASTTQTVSTPVQQTVTQTYQEPTYSYSGNYSSGYSAPTTTTSTTSYPSTSYTANYVEPAKAKFEPSEEYKKAMEEATKLLEQLKGGRTSYTDKINAALESIEKNPAFTYDFNTDPLFQAQLAASMRSGQQAMQDTIGQASALTGGYGSSYGQAVGNQAYNSYIQDAYNNLPEYANLALDVYNSDLNNKYNLLNQYRYGDETEYQRALKDWENQYMVANDQYAKEYENYWQEQGFNEDSRRWASEFNDSMDRFIESIRQYDNDFNEKIREYDTDDAFRKERAARSDYEWDTSFDYQKERDAVSDSQWDKQYGLSSYKTYNSGSGSSSSKSSSDSSTKNVTNNTETTYKKASTTQYNNAKKAYESGGMTALESYVDTLPDNIDIEALYKWIMENAQKPLSQRKYTTVKDTVNWLGGLDRNDIVEDEYGNQWKLIDLAKAISEQEGIPLEEAKKIVSQYNGTKKIIG